MKETGFRLSVGSDIDFEDLIAYVAYKNELVAFLTQEEGFENMKIRIFPPENSEYWEFDLDEFENIVARGKKRLWELRRTPDQKETE